ncbi:DUF6069 family protein [Nocardia suismassiliense]|uniref:DUF6069 family protein n=1 Tax=Nocardia suismassiliense TaxID=2077092 RepID=UPI000D1DCB24|nr:DUF6069 family protein [Nocardia suismassiliense]
MTTTQTIAPALRIPAVNRPVAVLGSAVVAVAVNLVVWLIGKAAGGSFEVVDKGVTTYIGGGTVIMSSAVPLLIGMTLAALLSYRWVGVLRVAQVVGSVLAVATIGLTVSAGLDAATTVALSVMHLVLAPVIIVGLEALRRGLTA